MQEVLLVVAVVASFVFGYIVVRKWGAFYDENACQDMHIDEHTDEVEKQTEA